MNFFKQCLAEFIGTFALVFAGCASVIIHQNNPEALPSVAIPFVFGGIVSVMIYALGHISGAHFNPAVTIAFSISRHFPKKRVIFYIIAQVLGAFLASFIHSIIFAKYSHNFGATTYTLGVSSSLFIEIILTFFLMLVIISVATDTRAEGQMAGLAIGSTVAVCALFGGPLTGASMNPARSLSPNVFSGDISILWLYFIGPIIGAAIASILYEYIMCFNTEENQNASGCC